jgi:outer membrane protein TolC
MFAFGRIKQIDVQRSMQEQLQAEQALIVAQADYRAAVDDFKIALGIPVDQPIDVLAQELAVAIPHFVESEVTELALRYRLDLRTAEDRVEDAQRGVQVAKNGLLPDLELAGSGTFGNSPGDSAARFNNDQTTYSGSLTLEIPLDRLAERNRYRSSLVSLERSQRSAQELRDRVAGDARNSLRQIRSAQLSLEIQRQGIELAKARLENSIELLRRGANDSRDVVEAQDALVQAQDAFAVANATLQIQILRFLRDTGTLRLDPEAGAIGAALDRKAASAAVNEPSRGG